VGQILGAAVARAGLTARVRADPCAGSHAATRGIETTRLADEAGGDPARRGDVSTFAAGC
jgi:hypothetical protein